MKVYFMVLTLIFGFQGAQATQGITSQDLMTPEEQEIHTRARKKMYPGGRDEDPLKVQNQLPPVTRKMGPAQEAPEDQADDAPTD